MRIGRVRKGTTDRLDYDVLYGDWLTEADTIFEAEAVIEENTDDSPLVIDSVAVFNDQNKVKVWLSGGLEGETYNIALTVTTDQGRIKTVCFQVRMTSC
jgi:hypothetical protein